MRHGFLHPYLSFVIDYELFLTCLGSPWAVKDDKKSRASKNCTGFNLY